MTPAGWPPGWRHAAAAARDDLSPSPSLTESASAQPSLVESPSGPSASEVESSEPSPTAGNRHTFTVRGGDTLSSISRAWGTTVRQLQTGMSRPTLAGDRSEHVVWADPDGRRRPGRRRFPPSLRPPRHPTASGCRAGNRVAAGAQQIFTAVRTPGHAVALTLDMGGRLEPGLDILNLLIANKVCVTIFPTGAMAQTTQGMQVMALIRAHPELFELGNHTMHHCDLLRGGGGSPTTAPCAGVTPTADFIRRELTEAGAILAQLSGQQPVPYWRPPYGLVTEAVRDAAASVGYTKTFMWDIDTIDWKPIADGGPTAQQIATKVISNARDGSNVLMHLGGYETLEALRIMIPGLRDRGYLLTSLSDLLN